jgi:predicted GIY-YIG superfamily endonuclease
VLSGTGAQVQGIARRFVEPVSSADILMQLGICRDTPGAAPEVLRGDSPGAAPEAPSADLQSVLQITEAETEAEVGKPWYCYLLISTSGNTYIGATVDPDRRLRQHNKELVGGARRTGAVVAAGERWERVCKVAGFPDNHAALQFEWRWKRLSCKKVYAHKTPIERRLAGLHELLGLDRPTSRAQPYSSYRGGGPRVEWEK